MSPFHLQSNDAELRLVLSGDATIEHARALHAALVTALSADTTLHIDAGEVSRLDAAIMQLVLAAARTARRTEIGANSPAWSQALQRFGLEPAAFHRPASLDPDLP